LDKLLSKRKLKKGVIMEQQKELEDIKQGLELIKPYLIKEEYDKLQSKLFNEFITSNVNALRHQLKLLVNEGNKNNG
tara:strand:+ start:620 stop:850 length:231 start_codon:yes stop_codon:yes gene_type:complete